MSQLKVDFSLGRVNLIKGLAITAVVFIHLLAYLPGVYTNQSHNLFFIFLDQVGRFCVPGFIILSGFGLATKHLDKTPKWWLFFKHRMTKLLPLYLFWSLVSIVLFQLVPSWSSTGQKNSLVFLFLFGQADYQLYFLPVILQLYAIFPLLWLLKKRPNLLFSLSLIIQLLAFLFFTFRPSNTDRFEYVLAFSWLGYFGFGIWLKLQTLSQKMLKLVWPGAMVVLLLIVYRAKLSIDHGLDPLPALKFTRFSIIPFALLFNLGLVTIITFPGQKNHLSFLLKTLRWLGKNSYLIFLAHTIGLRLFFSLLENKLPFPLFLLVSSIWLVAIFISYKLKPSS